MARRRAAVRRIIPADPRYDSVLLTRFINKVMLGGKKTKAQHAVYTALEALEQELNRPGLEIFEQAVRNATPALEVRSRRVGGATYQVPVEVRPVRRQTLAMRWIIDAARKRSEKSMAHRLAHELLDAAENRGTAVKKKEDTHRMAEANKAFSHYRW